MLFKNVGKVRKLNFHFSTSVFLKSETEKSYIFSREVNRSVEGQALTALGICDSQTIGTIAYYCLRYLSMYIQFIGYKNVTFLLAFGVANSNEPNLQDRIDFVQSKEI